MCDWQGRLEAMNVKIGYFFEIIIRQNSSDHRFFCNSIDKFSAIKLIFNNIQQ